MVVKKETTFDLDAATRTREWKPLVSNKKPTTHQITTQRFTEKYKEKDTPID